MEDDAADAYIARRHLRLHSCDHHRFAVEHVRWLRTGLDRLSEDPFEIVLLDLGLPDSRGFATFSRASREAPEIPIIVLSGLGDEQLALRAVREGAQDYLVKAELTGPLLVRAIRYAIERHRMQSSLRRLSLHDELTGLYNRRGFQLLGEQQLKQIRRNRRNLTLVFLDVDGLKEINDRGGHQAGDAALVEAAEVLRRSFRESDVVARMGGDEFVVLLLDAAAKAVPVPLERLRRNLRRVNALADREHPLSMSHGLASWDPQHPCALEELVARADQAMYREKRARQELRQARIRDSIFRGEHVCASQSASALSSC